MSTVLCMAAIIFSLGASAQAKPETATRIPSIDAFEQVTAQTGWILFGEKLYWTNTDGAAWTDITPAANIRAVDFIDAARGWTVVSASTGYSLTLTANGGRSWLTLPLRLPTLEQADTPIAKVFMDWRTNLHGWLVFKLATGINFSRGMLFVTFDGGRSWAVREIPLGEPVTFTDENNGWVSGGPTGTQTFRTHDGGLSWESVSESRDPIDGQNEAGWKLWESGECADDVCTREIKLLTASGGVPMQLPNGRSSLRENISNAKKISALADSDTTVYIGQGFDACEIPNLTKMNTWWTNSPYGAVNLYIGGISRACANSLLSASLLTQLNNQGWRFIPTWVGLQAACSAYPSRMSSDKTTAYTQGVQEASAAVATAQSLGLTNVDGSGTVIYFDLEAYDTTNKNCRDAANAFINGWTFQMRALGNLAGVYASPCNAADWWSSANVPDALWIANWYGAAGTVSYTPTASVYNTACIDNSLWNNHRRLRQYAGGHNETWGGARLNIDSNVLDGPVTVPNGAGGGLNPDPPSAPNPADGASVAQANDTWLSWKTNGDSCSIHVWGGTLDTTASNDCSPYHLGEQAMGSYSWQVTATNTFGSTPGPIWHLNVSPAAPTGLTAVAASSTQINLTWTASTDTVDNTLVFVDGVQAASVSGSATSYQVQNLMCKSTHSFYVKSEWQGIISEAGNTVSATTRSCTPVLLSPRRIVTDSLQPTFTWRAVTGTTQYLIQISKYSSFSVMVVDTRTSDTSYTPILPLAINTRYFWRIRAIGTFGTSDWATTYFTTPNPPPAPTLTAPANNSLVTNYRPRLDWQDVTPPTGTTLLNYQIQVSSDSGFAVLVQDATVTASEFTPLTKLLPNQTYYWRVRAVNTLGHKGEWSAAWNFRTALLAPRLVSPANASILLNRRPDFDWSDVPGASSYTLQVSAFSNFSSLIINTPSAVSNFTLPADLPANLTLYWRVRTNGFNGPSLWSTRWSFQTGNPPGIPALVSPRNTETITNLMPLLVWRTSSIPAGTTFDHYQLQIATDASFASIILDQAVNTLSPAEYALTTPLLANTKYYWRVQAFNTKGEYSAWSTVWSFSTPKTTGWEWMMFWKGF
jgi:hypothetical protein